MITLRTPVTTTLLAAAAWAAALVGGPETLRAQDGWWDWNLRELSVRVTLGPSAERHVPRVLWSPAPAVHHPRGRKSARKAGTRGPAFCRSGAGHPVFGRRWCLDKGFGLGGSAYPALRWERRYWEGHLPRHAPRPPVGTLDRHRLLDVLGPTVYDRLDRERARLGGHGGLTGRWIRPDGSSFVLQIRSGPVAVAELTDFGADGRIDVIFVATP